MITLDSKIQKGEKEKEMKNKKLWIFGGIILLIVILNHIFDWSSYISTAENLEFMKRIVQNNLPLAILLYMVLTVVGCVVLALPGVTFAILAGLLFGPVIGTICCSLATTIGAVLAFIAGRFFLKDSIGPVVAKNRILKKWLFDDTGCNELFVGRRRSILVKLFAQSMKTWVVQPAAFTRHELRMMCVQVAG
mgnify:CR=1 FL=1